MAKRIALIISNQTYQDATLSRLKTPTADLHALEISLCDPKIGNFDRVSILLNPTTARVRDQVAGLLYGKKRYDLLLLYFLGHGLLDESGALYLATTETKLDSLPETAVPAAYLTEQMDRSFSRQQMLLLDCYYSAVLSSAAAPKPGQAVGTGTAFKGKGHGRVILTASDTTHYTLVANNLSGHPDDSLFSHYFLLGLQTGAADADQDGQIGMRELGHYLSTEIQNQSPAQQPRQWTYREQDRFIIARNPNHFQGPRLKWDLLFGAVMAPLTTIVIGGQADLSASVGMAGLLLLLYAGLYWVLE
jgi:uncharacterized caspase-like protein